MKSGQRADLDPQLVTNIVGDGAMASPETGGILFPVLIVDARNRFDVREAIRLSAFSAPGDVVSQWGMSKGVVILHIQLVRPVAAELYIPFDLPGKGVLVDGLLEARAFYLQDGKPGDRIKHDIDHQRLIVQVAHAGFETEWPAVFKTALLNDFRKRGLKLGPARAAADEMYENVKGMTRLKLRPGDHNGA